MNSLSGSTGMSGSATGMKEKRPHGYQKFSMQQFTPEQIELFRQMIGQLGPEGFLAKLAGGDESLFNQMETPALRQFSELQGGLASRFSGMGDLGARNSSGFQNAGTAAASNFAEQLQANRLGLQNQALRDLQGMGTQLLGQRPVERGYVKKDRSPSGWGGLAGAAGGGLAGFLAGGPPGAMTGANIGYNALSGF